jgi:ParB-like chromosome segregation protein Spo0J
MATKPKQIPRTTQPEHGSYSEPNSSRFLYVKVTDISPTTNNPRKHNRQQIRAIATSISAFGFCAPILIDRDKQIVAGHGRFEAAKLLGYSHVPAVSLEHLDPHRACAYMLADNKLTDRSKWDDGKLAIHLKELSELALDFEIEATGFELAEIDLRVQSLDGSDVDAADEFNPAAGPATSQAGDIWMTGDHRLYCGSALETVSYERLLQSEKAAAVFADPPYNVRIDGHVSGNGAIRHREFSMASGEMNESEFTQFLTNACKLLRDNSPKGALLCVCMDWRHMKEVQLAGDAAGFELINLCVCE